MENFRDFSSASFPPFILSIYSLLNLVRKSLSWLWMECEMGHIQHLIWFSLSFALNINANKCHKQMIQMIKTINMKKNTTYYYYSPARNGWVVSVRYNVCIAKINLQPNTPNIDLFSVLAQKQIYLDIVSVFVFICVRANHSHILNER